RGNRREGHLGRRDEPLPPSRRLPSPCRCARSCARRPRRRARARYVDAGHARRALADGARVSVVIACEGGLRLPYREPHPSTVAGLGTRAFGEMLAFVRGALPAELGTPSRSSSSSSSSSAW